MLVWIPVAAGAAAAALVLWSLFEAQWVEFSEVEIPIRGLPPELDGFCILHLSDFHLGTVSLNARALARALRWAGGREVDLVAVTGDLVSRRRGERALRRALAALRARHGVYAVLGNHEVAETRDPFSEPADVSSFGDAGAVLLADSARSFEVGRARVQVAGVEPRADVECRSRPDLLADPQASLRISPLPLPRRRRPPARGALPPRARGSPAGGQICIPLPGGKLRLAHLRARYWEGLFRLPATALYVSRGLGTTFVPFRLFARPEATVLTLRPRH